MRISNHHLSVDIAPLGAELQSIVTPDGEEWLWNGDPQWWTGRAPLLFPVVGKSPGGEVTIAGLAYPMQPHGFARRTVFEIAAEHQDRAMLVLKPSAETRKSFPFEFFLSVTYALERAVLVATAEVGNLGETEMPFGFGFHPAFRWPLPGGEGQRHVVRLGNGGAPRYQLLNGDGLILPEAHDSPFVNGEMAPEPRQFELDALLFPFGIGPAVSFGVAGGPTVSLTATNLPNFGIWQKPGAPYLCLEPWHGMAARADGDKAIEHRPGTLVLPPNGTTRFELRLTFTPAAG
jgi:galactose mutarotase-like enzyme